jgi:hypothetical protein
MAKAKAAHAPAGTAIRRMVEVDTAVCCTLVTSPCSPRSSIRSEIVWLTYCKTLAGGVPKVVNNSNNMRHSVTCKRLVLKPSAPDNEYILRRNIDTLEYMYME